MSVLSDTVASLRDVGAIAEVVRDSDEGGFAWAELGGIAASIDIVTDNNKGSWFAHVTAANADSRIIEHRPSATQLHSIVLSLLQTESNTTMDHQDRQSTTKPPYSEDGRMQLCGRCNRYCGRTLNMCPTCPKPETTTP